MRSFRGPSKDKAVFREWARSWIRRALIKTAIQSAFREPRRGKEEHEQWWKEQTDTGISSTIDTITQLAPVDRFVFVMSVLEGYSTKECSLLLDCALGTVIDSRMRALLELASAVRISTEEASTLQPCAFPVPDVRKDLAPMP